MGGEPISWDVQTKIVFTGKQVYSVQSRLKNAGVTNININVCFLARLSIPKGISRDSELRQASVLPPVLLGKATAMVQAGEGQLSGVWPAGPRSAYQQWSGRAAHCSAALARA